MFTLQNIKFYATNVINVYLIDNFGKVHHKINILWSELGKKSII